MKTISYILIATIGSFIFPVLARAAIYWDPYLGSFAYESSAAYAYDSMLSSYNYGCITMMAASTSTYSGTLQVSAGTLYLAHASLTLNSNSVQGSGGVIVNHGVLSLGSGVTLGSNVLSEINSSPSSMTVPAPEIDLAAGDSTAPTINLATIANTAPATNLVLGPSSVSGIIFASGGSLMQSDHLAAAASSPETTMVPEPSALALSGAALVCLALYRRHQSRYKRIS
jgi:autotransporter-associated beta strand protein